MQNINKKENQSKEVQSKEVQSKEGLNSKEVQSKEVQSKEVQSKEGLNSKEALQVFETLQDFFPNNKITISFLESLNMQDLAFDEAYTVAKGLRLLKLQELLDELESEYKA